MPNTGLAREGLDKFYTTSAVAKACVDKLMEIAPINRQRDVVVEPSAGAGAFVKHLKPLTRNGIYFDIDPAAPETPPTPESNIAMMHKYSARIDTHREAWASTQRMLNSQKKNDEGHMWDLADALFDCHAGDHTGNEHCMKLKQEYDALYRKHYG